MFPIWYQFGLDPMQDHVDHWNYSQVCCCCNQTTFATIELEGKLNLVIPLERTSYIPKVIPETEKKLWNYLHGLLMLNLKRYTCFQFLQIWLEFHVSPHIYAMREMQWLISHQHVSISLHLSLEKKINGVLM